MDWKGLVMEKKNVIKSYYEPKLDQGLPDFEVLGWESDEAQHRRFDALLENVQMQGKKLLDVGCGLCNLLEYLLKKEIDIDYTGVDISDRMIACAREKGLKASLHCMDVFQDETAFASGAFDVVYTSGIFNLDLGNNEEFLKLALTRLFALSNKVVAFNLLHNNSPGRESRYFYFSPDRVQEIIKETGLGFSHIQIIEGYLGNDFTVICRK